MTEVMQTTAASTETTAAPATTDISLSASTPAVSAVEAPANTAEVNKTPSTSWRDSLPADLKEAKALQTYDTIEDVARGYVNVRSLIGKRHQDLTPEESSLLYSKLGKPDSQDKYTFPEGLSEDQNKWFRDLAFKNGLTQEQAKQMADSIILRNRETEEYVKAEHKLRYEKGVEELKKEFGGAFDKRLEIAVRAAKEFGGVDLINALKDAGVDNNPSLIKAFAQIGQKLLADKIVDADKSTAFGTTPADARNLIKEMQTNQGAVILNHNHPDHGKVKAEMDRLYQVAYAG